MLSKSQARLFFVSGTVLFSLLFLVLTIDTVRQVPAQTKDHNITPAVERGKHLWDKNNCMGCHTLLGEGAYYAPELTKVYERRGAVWMDAFLKDPQAMFPGERKMVQYNFTAGERKDLIAFFKWIGEMDLNGFPPKPRLNQSAPSQPAPSRPEPNVKVPPRSGLTASTAAPTPRSKQAATSQPGKQPGSQPVVRVAQVAIKPPVIFQQLCKACHSVDGQGGRVGPALDRVGKKYNPAYLEKWLADPQAVKPGTRMPKLPLSEQHLAALVAYLSQLK